MNHRERRQEVRRAEQHRASLNSHPSATVHCRIVNRHIPIAEALAKHEPDGEYCFSCGRGGNHCRQLSGPARDRG